MANSNPRSRKSVEQQRKYNREFYKKHKSRISKARRQKLREDPEYAEKRRQYNRRYRREQRAKQRQGIRKIDGQEVQLVLVAGLVEELGCSVHRFSWLLRKHELEDCPFKNPNAIWPKQAGPLKAWLEPLLAGDEATAEARLEELRAVW